jgi:hypothetical protein
VVLTVHFACAAYLLAIYGKCLPVIADHGHPLRLNHAPHVGKSCGEVSACEEQVFPVPNPVLCLSLVPKGDLFLFYHSTTSEQLVATADCEVGVVARVI